MGRKRVSVAAASSQAAPPRLSDLASGHYTLWGGLDGINVEELALNDAQRSVCCPFGVFFFFFFFFFFFAVAERIATLIRL